MSKIKFVTDSAADIPAELVQELDILVIPFMIADGDRELRDCVDFTQQEFYELLQKADKIPTHSQINPAIFEEIYTQMYEAGYEHLIYTSINSKGSATWQNAVSAVNLFFEDHPEAKGRFAVTVLDSRAYTYAYGYAVVEGAKMAREGKSAEEIAAWMQDWLDHVCILFSTYTLKFVKKSGRVSAAAAFLGDAIGLKPVMSFPDGDSKVLGKVRGEKAVIPKLIEMMQAEIEPGAPYLCLLAGNEAQNAELIRAAEKAMGYPCAQSIYIGGVIAINAGPDLNGVAYRKK